jgi:lectin-like protein/PEP-CTERM motif-containing protein
MIKRMAAVAVLAMISSSASAGIIYMGSEYSLTSAGVGWQAAENQAVVAGGHLVAINSQAEQDFLRNTFGTIRNFWIGLTDVASEGNFVWSNGDAVTYTNWATSEPNNLFNEDYVLMNWNNSNGGWNDCDGYSGACFTNIGIIEIAVAVVPEPGTLGLLGLGLIGLGFARRAKRN